jgi:hypothetical protein
MDSWPPLAWIAKCSTGSNSIQVIHGADIERRPHWFCEAVWDGSFGEGDFDRTDLVFGSGGRHRGDEVIFVSAGSTVDRLHIAVRDDCTFISNSLACLIGISGARPDTTFRRYAAFFATIKEGTDKALTDLPVLNGAVQLIYHNNLRWDGRELHIVSKPQQRRDFSSFERYAGFLRGALKRIGENMSSGERKISWSWLGTISRGYDSAACAALAREAGLRCVMTHNESRPDVPDDGSIVARALDLNCFVVNRLAWKDRPLLEPLFLAGDAQGKDIMLAGAHSELRRTVLLTGHAGDSAWSLSPHRFGETMGRAAHSGLSLTEYRLHAGFIHLPAPFMGLRQQPDLVSLSRSAEMSPWKVGHAYDRPICRRILEEAGVARDVFGVAKTGASIRFLSGEDAWSQRGKHALFAWLRKHRADYGLKRQSLLRARLFLWTLELTLLLQRKTPALLRGHLRAGARVLAQMIQRSGLNDLAFFWAMDTVRKSYRPPPGIPSNTSDVKALK